MTVDQNTVMQFTGAKFGGYVTKATKRKTAGKNHPQYGQKRIIPA